MNIHLSVNVDHFVLRLGKEMGKAFIFSQHIFLFSQFSHSFSHSHFFLFLLFTNV